MERMGHYPNQRADPWVYKYNDGWYYFTAAMPAFDLIELRSGRVTRPSLIGPMC